MEEFDGYFVATLCPSPWKPRYAHLPEMYLLYMPRHPRTSRHVLKSTLTVSLRHRSCIVRYLIWVSYYCIMILYCTDRNAMPSGGVERTVGHTMLCELKCVCRVYWILIVKMKQGFTYRLWLLPVLPFGFATRGPFCFGDRRWDRRSRFDMVVGVAPTSHRLGAQMKNGILEFQSDKVRSLCVLV